MKNKQRFKDVDRLKGLAIFLVVLGHIAGPDTLYVQEWYINIRSMIYKFHMPLFMFLSGLMFYYTYTDFQNIREYKEYVIKKSKRIIPPFIIFSLIIFLGKLYSSSNLYVENMDLDNLAYTYFLLYLQPSESFIGSYWYIYVLLEFLLLFPLLLKLSKNNMLLWIGIGIIIFFIPTSDYFAINMFTRNFVFFALGIFIMQHYDVYIDFLTKNRLILVSLFLFSFVLTSFAGWYASLFFIGMFSIFALHSLIIGSLLNKSNLLITLGRYTFVIYLLNTVFIGLSKAVLIKMHSPFIIIFILSVLSGVIFPILIKKYIFKKIKYFDRITN